MDIHEAWHYEVLGLKAVKALRNNRFSAEFYKTAQEAAEQVLSAIPLDATVGFGGSWTIQNMGLLEALEERGNTVFCHHKPGLSPEEILDLRRRQLTCDVFLTSTNAVTLDGKLVNTDATGNRVAAMTFGPEKVIIVAGANKVVKDLSEAHKRIAMLAAPLNNKRLKRTNPCAETGECSDCQGPTRLCNITTVLHKRPPVTDIHVWLVGERLGF